MPSLGYATISVLANTKPFEASLKKSVTRVAAATAVVAGGFALGKAIGNAVGNAVQLERELARINTIVNDTDMEAYFNVDAVRAFSNEAGIATDALTEGLYRALSSGTEAADALGLVGQAVKLQLTQPGTELTTVVDALTSALNAYGPAALDAGKASDILFRAAQFGKGTFQDFSHYISTAIPIAEDLGVSFEELAAVGAASTRTGKTARVVFTGLKVAMQELSDSSKNAGKIFKEEFGETFQEYVGRTGDLTGAFAMLSKVVGTKNLTNVFGAKEGAQAVKLLASQASVLPEILRETANSAGVVNTEVEKIEATVGRQFDRLKIRVTNAMGALGDAISPTIARVLGGVADMFDKIAAKGPEIQAALAPVGTAIAAGWAMVLPTFQAIWTFLSGIDWAGVGNIIMAVATGLATVFGPVFLALNEGAQVILTILGPALNWLIGILQPMLPLVAAIAAAWAAYRVMLIAHTAVTVAALAAQGALAAAQKVGAAITLIQTGAVNRLNIALTLAAVKARIMAIASSTMLGPVGLIVIAIAALAAGFLYAWKKSDKFKQVVVNTWNTVKDATLTAVKAMLDVFEMYVVGILTGFLKILQGLGKLPKWLGGGAFDSAAGFVQNLIDGVHAISDSLDGLIAKAKEADWALKQVGLDDMGAEASAAALKDPAFLKTLEPNAPKPNFGGGGGINFGSGGGTKNFGDDAAAKAKEAANKIKAAMGRIGKDLDRIAKNTSKQTVDAIKNNFQTLYSDMAEGKVSKAVIKQAKEMEKKLVALAKKRDSVVERLNSARDALQSIKDEAASFVNGIRDQVNGLGNVAQATKGIAQTFLGIRNQLRYAVKSTQEFVANINRLRALGLNPTNLRQLIEAGPEAAGDAARILAASGGAGIKQINDLQAQLDAAGASLANSAYDQFYKQGVAVAQGLVNGLQSQEAALLKQMDKLGDRIATQFKKKLGIKSPSRVFAGLGEMLPEGLAKGIDTGIPVVRKAGQNMVDASMHFHEGSVAVNGVADPRAARRAGILAGTGIQGVLAQKRANQVLDGIS